MARLILNCEGVGLVMRELGRDIVMIGRSPSNHIVIDHPTVSAQHAGDYEGAAQVKKRASSNVEFWQGQLKRLDTPMTVYDPVLDGQGLLQIIGQLLEGYETGPNKFVDENGEIFELEKVVPLSDPDLIDFEHTHFLKGIKKSWTGTEKDFLKVFSKVE